MKRVYVVNANNVSTPCKFTVASDAANFVRDLLVDASAIAITLKTMNMRR
jgi:hypothetical protein